MATAILIDGDFFLRRYRKLRGDQDAQAVAKAMHKMCLAHLKQSPKHRDLYRIFFYDCPPLMKKVHNPVNKRSIDYSKSALATWRLEFFKEVRKLRLTALRLGVLSDKSGHWTIKEGPTKKLLRGDITVADLKEDDVKYEVNQKGVDMRIGLDIASMCFKGQVDQIILVAGDSDFVPAAKLARREGIDFVLDPLGATIRSDLMEHVDGLQTVLQSTTSAKS